MSHIYTIRPGDSLVNIAYENGLLVEALWIHADNAALRAKRPDRNILMPGDKVAIFDRQVMHVAAATGQRHRFRLKDVPHNFSIQLFDNTVARRHQAYKLMVRGDGFTASRDGVTDGQGVLTARIPPRSVTARLSIDNGESTPLELDILFGSLDPVEELSGVQKRLANLGYNCPVDGVMGAVTRQAIEAFQRRFSLPLTGKADSPTQERLRQMNEEISSFPPAANSAPAENPG